MRFTGFIAVLGIQATVFIGAGQAMAGCLTPPLSEAAINQFKSSPAGLVAPSQDTRSVELLVRDLAGTNASLAADLVGVARHAAPRFQTAIAAGLAQAAMMCSNVDQEASLLIQQAVASFEDGQFQASFAAVAGDLSTAAVDAASSSAAGSAGSNPVINPNSSRATATPSGGGGGGALVIFSTSSFNINAVPTNTASTNATPGGVTTGSVNLAPSNVATTAADPVSSSRQTE